MSEIYEANGAKFIATDDMIVWWCRKHKKPFEPETTAWMFEVMAAGAYVDIGVSTGWFAIPMALRGCEVTGFDPNPAVFSRLQANLLLNDVEIDCHNAAVSFKPGVTKMWINPAVRLTSGGSIEKATCNNPRCIEVRTVRLDDLKLAPRLIKVDVEGHELSVLAGAEETIKQHRPHMVLEANTETHRNGLAKWLAAYGYTWARADDRNMLCTPS